MQPTGGREEFLLASDAAPSPGAAELARVLTQPLPTGASASPRRGVMSAGASRQPQFH